MIIVLIGMVVGVIVFFLLAMNLSNRSGYRSSNRRSYHPRERGDRPGHPYSPAGETEPDAESRFRPPDYIRFSSGCFFVSVVLIIAAILVVALVVLWSIAQAGGL